MPIYEYKCKKCHKKFELLMGLNESEKDLKCPECGADYPEKVFSSLSFSKGGSCSSDSFT